MLRFLLATGLFLSALPAARASGAPRPYCAAVPRLPWMSAPEVQLRLKALGLDLLRLRIGPDRCYAILAQDSAGRRHDMIMHPVTADILADRS